MASSTRRSAGVASRPSRGRPRRDACMARQKAAVERTLAELEKDPPHRIADIGSLSVACALGYLDFRFAAEPWRDAHPNLAAWFEAFAATPGIARTIPRDPT